MGTQVAELAAQFKAEASMAGAVVYEAASAEDASNYILKLAQERHVKTAVKSKSKVADEIKLRNRLEKAGIEVKNADLKEWISQLACEKTTERNTIKQVAKLISEATGKKLNSDPQVLLNAANQAIRQYCIDADMGISEADVAIAETGTLVISGNEGVTRLVAVLPRMHVTLVNSQNVVAVMEEVTAGLESFKGDIAGQVMPAYVTYITGRNTTADIPGAVLARAQGPAEEHVILMNKVAGRGSA